MLGANDVFVHFGESFADWANSLLHPPVIYKYMKSSDLHYWFDKNTIRLGTMSNYRERESKPNQYGVADGKEGFRAFFHDPISACRPLSPEQSATIAKMGIVLPPGIHAEIRGNYSYQTAPDSWLFCASTDFCMGDLNKWNLSEGYDAVVKIIDIRRFIYALSKAFNLKAGNRQTLFVDLVHYDQLVNAASGESSKRIEFFKSPEYNWQKEIRFMWPSFGREEPVSLNIDALNSMIKLVDIGG